MNTTKFKGHKVKLLNDLPEIGDEAFDITLVKNDLTEQSLFDLEDKIKVLIGVPSLDLGICQTETRKFNKALENKKDVIGIVISKDLPFAMKRFCETDGISNVIAGSDYRYGDFTREFNTEMIDGPFKGLSARTVFIVDKKNKIRYVQLVPEIGQEPDYDAVIEAIDSLIS
jgi:thiol peroxidase